MAIDDIVALSLSVQDASPKAAVFDVPLMLAKTPYVGGRTYSVSPSGLTAMTTDGFNTYDKAYVQMSKWIAQSGGAARAIIYGRTTLQTHVLTLIPVIANTDVGDIVSLTLKYQGVTATVTHTIVTNTVDAIVTALVSAINASDVGTAGVTAAPDDTPATLMTLTADVDGDYIDVDGVNFNHFSVEDTSSEGSIAAQLASIQAAIGGTFYGLVHDSMSANEIALFAAHAEANRLIYAADVVDSEVADSGVSDDVVSTLADLNYHRTIVGVSNFSSSRAYSTLLGRQLGQTGGTSNFAFQRLSSVAGATLSTSQVTNVKAKGGQVFHDVLGIDTTQGGRAVSGRPLDITHGSDLLRSRIQVNVFGVLVNNEKVNYTTDGVSQMKSAIEGALLTSAGDEFVAPGFFVTPPNLADISSAVKESRNLPDVEFHAVLTGAIESVTIAGTLSL